MERNTEYLLKLGASTMPTGGSNGGGGAAYLYKKGQLLFALGGGGGGGRSGRGGDGGGIGVAGQRGGGRNGGDGGQLFDAGTIPTIGVFPGGDTWGGVNWSSPSGGRISGCTPVILFLEMSFLLARIWEIEDLGQAMVVRYLELV